ncbi:MAG: Mth938-like domain-containing protein [Proteobacteria bacterium]|nr:Mth938-like domain-containing protein [Pseudomonadota bacterium]MDA1057316.1 Mth938-like domain-containing protein [Pseudomonadota bacterium]
MDVTPLVPRGRQIINSYGAGGFLVSGERYEGSLLVFPERVIGFAPVRWEDLTLDHLHDVITTDPRVELLLIGCGPAIKPLNSDIRAALREARIGIDLMDTGAACRTYNVLMAEDRRVAAAVIALD